MTLAFTTNTPRAGSRAMSAHHTEASAKRDTGLWITWDTDGEYAFEVGDTVVVIDRSHRYFNFEGVIDTRLTRSKYLVRFKWSDMSITGFHKSQLRKVEVKPAPPILMLAEYSSVLTWNDRDKFTCTWGTYKLKEHPRIPERFIAHQKRVLARKVNTPAVIELPAHSQSTINEARATFQARIAALGIDDDETRRMNAILEKAKRLPVDRPQSQIKATPRGFGNLTGQQSGKSRKARILDYPQLRVRKYA